MADTVSRKTIIALPFHDALNINLRLCALFGTIALYAVLGEPTPDHFGLAELLVGMGLVAVVGVAGGLSALRFNDIAGWRRAGAVFMVYGLLCGIVNGLFHDNALSLMLRDIVPFLFLFLPVFLHGFLRRLETREATLLTGMIVFSGICFALRVVYSALIGDVSGYLQMLSIRDPALLANAPTVLFAAVLLIGLAGYQLTTLSTLTGAARVLLLAGLAALPVIAMAVIQQRASVAYLAVALLCLFLYGLYTRPYRMMLPLLLGGSAFVMLLPFLTDIVQTLGQKHAMVGLNMRGREAMTVFDAIDGNVWTVLFGKGWGTTIVSPAVGGAVVNYTHSLITAIWLKTGLIGVALLVCYLCGLVGTLWRIARYRFVLALAIAGPFAVDVFLYASYKSLDFGLLLLLIPLWADRAVLLKKQAACST